MKNTTYATHLLIDEHSEKIVSRIVELKIVARILNKKPIAKAAVKIFRFFLSLLKFLLSPIILRYSIMPLINKYIYKISSNDIIGSLQLFTANK